MAVEEATNVDFVDVRRCFQLVDHGSIAEFTEAFRILLCCAAALPSTVPTAKKLASRASRQLPESPNSLKDSDTPSRGCRSEDKHAAMIELANFSFRKGNLTFDPLNPLVGEGAERAAEAAAEEAGGEGLGSDGGVGSNILAEELGGSTATAEDGRSAPAQSATIGAIVAKHSVLSAYVSAEEIKNILIQFSAGVSATGATPGSLHIGENSSFAQGVFPAIGFAYVYDSFHGQLTPRAVGTGFPRTLSISTPVNSYSGGAFPMPLTESSQRANARINWAERLSDGQEGTIRTPPSLSGSMGDLSVNQVTRDLAHDTFQNIRLSALDSTTKFISDNFGGRISFISFVALMLPYGHNEGIMAQRKREHAKILHDYSEREKELSALALACEQEITMLESFVAQEEHGAGQIGARSVSVADRCGEASPKEAPEKRLEKALSWVGPRSKAGNSITIAPGGTNINITGSGDHTAERHRLEVRRAARARDLDELQQEKAAAIDFMDKARCSAEESNTVLEKYTAEMKSVFSKLYDKNNSGFVNTAQFCEMFATKGLRSPPEELDEMMAIADPLGNGYINYSVFIDTLVGFIVDGATGVEVEDY